MIKPNKLEEEHLIFLNDLRESGEINMFGAGSYLKDSFDLTHKESNEIVSYWMKTFSERHA